MRKFKAVVAVTLTLALLAGCGAQGNSTQTGTTIEETTEITTEEETTEEATTKESTEGKKNSDKVADSSDMADVIDVVEDGMVPISGKDVEDGTYDVTVDSSSSMFKIASCELTVKNGNMTAKMTMSGTGYLYVYMGTGLEAADDDEAYYIDYEENDDGTHSFTVPVEALDKGIDVAAFSKRKELWYDRTLVFRADSLPDGVVKGLDPKTAEDLSIEDGEYTCEVTLEGGSGRASVTSPAKLVIKDGKITATIEWSSPNYDYMKLGDEKFDPVNTDGNSTFELPIEGFDAKIKVIGDTTAMSKPHEIEYTLTFDSTTLKKK